MFRVALGSRQVHTCGNDWKINPRNGFRLSRFFLEANWYIVFIFILLWVILIDGGIFSDGDSKDRDFSEGNQSQRWTKLAVYN